MKQVQKTLIVRVLAVFLMVGFITGYTVQQVRAELSDEEQFNIIKECAEKGDGECQFFLAQMYYEGKGVPQDIEKCIYWGEKAYEQDAHLTFGTFGLFGFVGKLEDSWNQYKLAQMYYEGKKVPKDYKQAIYCYTKAAEQGHADSQFELAQMYYEGKKVPKSYKLAAHWWTKAAEQGDNHSQAALALMYYDGTGVPQSYIYSYVWNSLAASAGNELAKKNRDIDIKLLSPQQVVYAQQISKQIQDDINSKREKEMEEMPWRKKTPSSESTRRIAEHQIKGSGTGFIITEDGYILTCHHVINEADTIKVRVDGNTYPAILIREDNYNDLALLKITGTFPSLSFSLKRSATMGQEVFTIGYPNPALQGMSAKLTKGSINSLTGFQDDIRLYQISVPVQPGNSGGPLLDYNGNVAGVIVAMLDAKTAFNISGSIPQNVNYAVKSSYAKALLDTLPEVADKVPSSAKERPFDDVVNRVKQSIVEVLTYE